jgi:hypothetical protein
MGEMYPDVSNLGQIVEKEPTVKQVSGKNGLELTGAAI